MGAIIAHRPLTIDSPRIPCSLPDPSLFLDALPGLLSPDGVVAIVSPYSWLEEWTPRDKWLGGLVRGGDAVYSAPELTSKMEALGFVLVEQSDMPFVIREHSACVEPLHCCAKAPRLTPALSAQPASSSGGAAMLPCGSGSRPRRMHRRV